MDICKVLKISEKLQDEYGLGSFQSTLFLATRQRRFFPFGLLDIYRKTLNKKYVFDILHLWERGQYYFNELQPEQLKIGNGWFCTAVHDKSLSAFGIQPGDTVKINTMKNSKREGLCGFKFKDSKYPIFAIVKKNLEEDEYVFGIPNPEYYSFCLPCHIVETKIEFLGTVDKID